MSKMKGPVHGDYFPDVDGVPSLVIRVQFISCFIKCYCDLYITTYTTVVDARMLVFL